MNKGNLNYTFVRPQEMRQRFTEFVTKHYDRAMVNTSIISHNNEDSFMNQSMAKSQKKMKKKAALNNSNIKSSGHIGKKEKRDKRDQLDRSLLS